MSKYQTIFIVQGVNWYYNDEYYREEGYALPSSSYTTRVAADAEARRKNVAELKAMGSHYGSNYSDYFEDPYNGFSKEVLEAMWKQFMPETKLVDYEDQVTDMLEVIDARLREQKKKPLTDDEIDALLTGLQFYDVVEVYLHTGEPVEGGA